MANHGLGRRWWTVALLAVGLGAAPPSGCKPGRVRFVQLHDSFFDSLTSNPSQTMQNWFGTHFDRMLVYTPSFDSKLSWYPNAWAYKDLYAIYNPSTLTTQHPSWVLRDGSSNALYIPWGCGGGTCPQYAADPGNAAFRSFWIDQARRDIVAKGYRGIFVDDVNMAIKVGDSTGQDVVPVDPRTGRPMTVDDWRRYVAEFVEAIRAAFPDVEVVHNAVWWFAPQTDPYVQRQIAACDVFWIERGVADGVTSAAFRAMLDFVDFLHDHQHGVVWHNLSTSGSDREYAMAAYLLTSQGYDGFRHGATSSPSDWWCGWDVDLGNPATKRLLSGGVWRRDFEHGTVLLNEPGQPTV